MTPLSFSLDCSDEPFPNVPNHDGPEALLHVRKSNEALSAMSDIALTEYENACFAAIPGASGDDRDELIHAVADCLVEKSNRRGAKQ